MASATHTALSAEVTLNVPYQKYSILVVVLDDVGREMLKAYDSFNAFPTPDTPGFWNYPSTPTLDAMQLAGVTFRWANAQANCSSFRGGLISGRYAHRNGLGTVVRNDERSASFAEFGGTTVNGAAVPSRREYTLPQLATQAGYKSYHCGKWHLHLMQEDASLGVGPTFDDEGIGWDGPTAMGYDDWFVGPWTNHNVDPVQPYDGAAADGTYGVAAATGQNGGWYGRTKGDTVSTLYNGSAQYSAKVQREKLVEKLNSAGQEPFFAVWAPGLAHSPYHDPRLAGYSTSSYFAGEMDDHPSSVYGYFGAMVEAFDEELGNLLSGIDPAILARTMVMVVGDNGTPKGVLSAARDTHGLDVGSTYDAIIDAPEDRYKNSVYELGLKVPLLVQGPLVRTPGRISQTMVDTHVDIFETCRNIMHVRYDSVAADGRESDGISFLPPLANAGVGRLKHARQFLSSHRFSPNGTIGEPGVATAENEKAYTMRVAGWGYGKLIRKLDGSEEFYKLLDDSGNGVDRFELSPLPLSGTEYETVRDAMDALHAS